MQPANTPSPTGHYVSSTTAGETVRAFVPDPLPPTLDLGLQTFDEIGRANRALGRLDAFYKMPLLPEAFTHLLTYSFIRKEALLSSQIEGTQSSFTDLLLHEDEQAPGVPLDDVVEVSNYVAALDHGVKRIENGFPLSLRLIREVHKRLLQRGRGQEKSPGEFRRSQVWLGGSRPSLATFVPPPANELPACLDAFEHFLHDPDYPILLKAALAHLQFETIHPFLDGNGRIGRLLITLILCAEEVLVKPILYLSLYFKAHRDEYYERLQRVRTHGEWNEWIRFFLTGVEETALLAYAASERVRVLFQEDQSIVDGFGRQAKSAMAVYQMLQHYPVTSIPQATERLDLTYPTVLSTLERMVDAGIVREITGSSRGRLYEYEAYMRILDEGTEPL